MGLRVSQVVFSDKHDKKSVEGLFCFVYFPLLEIKKPSQSCKLGKLGRRNQWRVWDLAELDVGKGFSPHLVSFALHLCLKQLVVFAVELLRTFVVIHGFLGNLR